jgi:hypothetical protein
MGFIDGLLEFGKTSLSGANLGNTLKGIGALATAFGTYKAAKADEDLLDWEKAQANDEKKRRDAYQGQLDNAVANVWGVDTTQPS